MDVRIEEISTNVIEVHIETVNPDLLALAIRAEEAADSAEDARDTAVQSAADALASEQAAAVSEGNALISENNAAQSASDAQGYANAANQSAGDASGYATSAGNSASAASTSASNALISEQNAAQSESGAQAEADRAETAANNASTSESNAAQSASDANDAKLAAEGFATDASDSADAASQSAGDALYQANRAKDEADRAETIANSLNKWYGIEYDKTAAASSVTRIGNMALHKSLPIQSRMRRCLLLDNGTVNYYLDPNDSTLKEDGTPAVLDGTDGQVMVEVPEHYVLFETDGNIQRVMMSAFFIDGFKRVPKSYVSAFEATVHRPTNTLASVINLSPDYRGGNNNAAWDAEDRSLLGKPATNISRTNFRNYARNRGSNRWNCMLHSIRKSVIWLYVVEYANRNCQLPFDPSLTVDGYRQGGLGNGVTTIVASDWITFNIQNTFVPCGITSQLGNNTGEVDYEIIGFPTATTVKVPSYRGIENIFGHLWEWTDGINVRVQSNADGGESQVYVADGLEFSDTDYIGYTQVGLQARVINYIKEVIFGDTGEIMATDASGASSSTYWCDQNYGASIPGSGEVLRGVLSGGRADEGAGAGLTFSRTNSAPVGAALHIGSRLCYITE